MHQWQGVGEEGLLKVFQENGAIQLDPLNPAGRNHDLFFLARIPDYKIGQFELVCYPDKRLFESYFSFLCAISREFFPYFYCKYDILYLDKYTRPRIEKFNEKARVWWKFNSKKKRYVGKRNFRERVSFYEKNFETEEWVGY